MSKYSRFPAYVSVAERKKQAQKKVADLNKKGKVTQPVVIIGRAIAKNFWGKAWCDNLESYSDFENRLPRGRTYVRNGSVIDLAIKVGQVTALVAGSSVYSVNILVAPVAQQKWHRIVTQAAGKIDSLIELLQGKISKGLMQIVTSKADGLFPHPKEINFKCSCPDWAQMCKHVAAVLYGVGARIDDNPQDLFVLRQANYEDLIAHASKMPFDNFATAASANVIHDEDLASLFDIDIESVSVMPETVPVVKKRPSIKKVAAVAKIKAKSKIVKTKAIAKIVTKAKAAVVAKTKTKSKIAKTKAITKVAIKAQALVKAKSPAKPKVKKEKVTSVKPKSKSKVKKKSV